MSIIMLKDLLEGLIFQSNNIDLFSEITCIGRDSRDISENGVPIFFVLKGKHFDASMFIKNVLLKNPATVTISDHDCGCDGIIVNDLFKAMAVIARRFYGYPDNELNTVAVTGTNGKSTIGFLLRHLLNSFSKTGLLGTIEYDTGEKKLEAVNTTPLATDFYKLLRTCKNNDCKNIVFEASSHAIDQKRIFGTKLDVAIFTNLSHEHLDYHKTLESYFNTKIKLFDGQNGFKPRHSLINIDDPYGRELSNILKRNKQNVFTFGEQTDADFCITSIKKNTLDGSIFSLKYENEDYIFETNLFGKHNISNIVASVSAACLLGYDLSILSNCLQDFKNVPGRMECINLANHAIVFIDYAHTPEALKMVLNTLKQQVHKRLITVFGCGGDRDRQKRAPMTELVTSLSDYAIATADNPRTEALSQIFDDMKLGVKDTSIIEFVDDRRLAIERAIMLSNPEDVILIAGRGHESIQNFGDHTVYFNDREVVQNINLNF